MKIGPLEILIILVVAFSAVLLFRLFRGDKRLTEQSTNNSVEVGTGHEVTTGINKFKKAGVALVILGIIILLFGKSTFELVMKMYLWAFILVVAGLVALVLSRKR